MKEFGPYVYRKYDNYTEIDDWDREMEVPTNPKIKRNVVEMVYNPYNYYNKERTADYS